MEAFHVEQLPNVLRKENERMIGIYALSFEDEIVYVGQSKDIDKRLYIHRLRYPHLKQHIVCTIDAYDREFLNELEVAHIAFFGTYGKLNKTRSGAGRPGGIVTKETRQKMSNTHKGRKKGPQSEEHRKKISEALKGKPLTEETKLKMSQSHRGERMPRQRWRKHGEN